MKQLEKLFGFAVVLVLSLAALRAQAQAVNSIDPALQNQIDRIARQVLEQTGVPSASVAVVKGGKLVYTQAYGSARLATEAAPGTPATPQMRYSIGSISKQFTAAAILLLQEEGKLSLDDANTFPASLAATRSPSARFSPIPPATRTTGQRTT
jgi:CubicO group peptidase (beta-lactamase class C family)